MKKIVLPILILCVLCFVACHKDPVKPATPPPTDSTTIGTLKINLISGEGVFTDSVKTNVELIISEPGGKVLLDTITPVNTHIIASLSTNATLVDLTSVFYFDSQQSYFVTTYKGVNPSAWSTDCFTSYTYSYYYSDGPQPATPLTHDSIIFTNVPTANLPAYNYASFSQNAFSNVYLDLRDPGYARIGYSLLPGNYAYLLYSTAGKYKMFIPTQGTQTVDCSTMDNITSANFSQSSYYTYFFSSIYGYSDSTNLNSRIQLYYNIALEDSDLHLIVPQLEYPTNNIQKYAVLGNFSSANQESAVLYSYGNTVNPNITYPDPGFYTINANQVNHFSVSWNAAKPTYYATEWVDSAVTWLVYASPDSTTITPLSLFTAQKPKMLQGQDLTKLNPYFFGYGNVQGYNYAGFLGLINDSVQFWQHPITSSVEYTKFF
jgi:hypothetical protein